MNKYLDYFIESSDCLYIYNRNFSIYGWPERERYTIVVNDDWNIPEDWMGFDDFDESIFLIIHLKDWFDSVLKGNLNPWECACLNKKYVIKEHVKLMMTTNPLQLRKTIDKKWKEFTLSDQFDFLSYVCLIKDIRFAIQIIQNHKIVNFKESAKDYTTLMNCESIQDIHDYMKSTYDELKSLTDGIVKKDIINKANKNE